LRGGPPLHKQSAAFQYTLNAQGRLTEPSEFGDIVVKVSSDGASILSRREILQGRAVRPEGNFNVSLCIP
jgi:hypothetical protein